MAAWTKRRDLSSSSFQHGLVEGVPISSSVTGRLSSGSGSVVLGFLLVHQGVPMALDPK